MVLRYVLMSPGLSYFGWSASNRLGTYIRFILDHIGLQNLEVQIHPILLKRHTSYIRVNEHTC